MAKATDVRPKITLACEVCKHRNYITKKNRRNDPDRMDLMKFCPATSATRCTARPADPGIPCEGPRCSWQAGAFVVAC